MTAGCGLEGRPARTARATTAPAIPGPLPLGGGRVESIDLGPFRVEAGATIPDLVVAFRHDGPPPPAPQVLVVHALTGSADAAGDWWAPLIGPGRALDTDRVGVLCANLLGGCYGTTGPRSPWPSPGHGPVTHPFPPVSVRDQARAQWALLDALRVERLALVAGGSLGGMVALEVALERPGAVEAVMPIASPAATGPLALAWNHLQLELVERFGDHGLDLARRLAMTTYRSEADFGERFGRRREPDGRYAVTSYLEHQGRKLVDRFDGDTYRVLVEAIDSHDIGRDRGGARQALERLAAARTRLVGVGIEGDILYGPDQVRELVDFARRAGMEATYREIHSTKGHDAFLVEWDQLATLVAGQVTGS